MSNFFVCVFIRRSDRIYSTFPRKNEETNKSLDKIELSEDPYVYGIFSWTKKINEQ